jgi:DNA-binding NarL/FixJ family response regulator
MTRKALIVEDHPIVSKSISDFIQSSIRDIECHIVTTGHDGLAYLNGQKPDIILLDINLPDMTGIEFCLQAKSRFSGLKILVITSIEQRHVIEQMKQMGVQGFILKSADTDEITEAIQQVINNDTYYSKTVTDILHNNASQSSDKVLLTRRETEILRLIADGLTNQEIAEKLFISAWTVDSHRKNLLVKFNARNTAILIKTAAAMGLLDY